MLISYCATALL